MNTYVVLYNDIDKNGNSLMYDYENIDGKTPLEAVRKRFKQPLKRLAGENGRYANVILTRGKYCPQKNVIRYDGNGSRYCYGIVNQEKGKCYE